MSLFIDVTELQGWQGKPTGVPRVMQELAKRFMKSDDRIIFVSWDGANYIQGSPKEEEQLTTEVSGKSIDVSTSSHKLRRVAGKSKYLKKIVTKAKNRSSSSSRARTFCLNKGDTLLILADWHGSDKNFVKYVQQKKDSGVRLVQISYDMLPVVTPQYSGHSTDTFRFYVEQIYPICDLIIAISQHTKNDITNWLKINSLHVPKIEVMRLGEDFGGANARMPQDRAFLENNLEAKDFILCVGTFEARKNHSLLYYTYKLSKNKSIDIPQIVIVGRRGWKTDDIFDLIKLDPDTADKFVFLENVSDEELAWLYLNCRFTVYPSFYEGWGLPIAESIYYGAPCVASNTSSMPEVAGNLIRYFNPSSTDECLHEMTNLLNAKKLKQAKKEIKKYKFVSWDSTFKQVNDFIKGV